MTGGDPDAPDPDAERWASRWHYAADPGVPPRQSQGYQQQGYGQQGYRQPGFSPTGHGQPGSGHSGYPGQPPALHRQPGRHGIPGGGRRGSGGHRKRIIITSVVVAALAVVAAAGFVVPRSRRGATAGFVPTAGSPSGDAKQLAGVFLSAWERNNLRKAASYTDDPAAALTALRNYQKYLNLRTLTSSVQSAAAISAAGSSASPGAPDKGASPSASPSGAAASMTLEKVAFQLGARVAAAPGPAALSGTWTYRSSLVAYQAANSSGWYIEWQPDVVAPNLTAGQRLAAVSAPATVNQVADSGGTPLGGYGDAGLSYIASPIEQQGTSGPHGRAGLDVQIETAAGKAVPGSQAVIAAPQDTGTLATTISPRAEAAARTAVSEHPNSSMVAIQPSTGDILAIANNDGYDNFALTARVAPGSTMKIITTTALFTRGLATAYTGVACPSVYTVQGVSIHNDAGMSEPPGTPLWYDFAVSCNDAFTQWWQKLSATSPNGPNKLAATAQEYYGLDEPWDIGIGGQSATYFHAPPSASGSELAEEDFGEGLLQTCPLAMASVAATVESGSFKQPILVPGTRQVSATPIPAPADAWLHKEMQEVVLTGTAAGQGFGPGVYAKTGTADINGQQQPNSWFVAFDPAEDVAVAALDLDAGYGAQNAAPEMHSFLSQYTG
jgi:hypothetical protein